MRILTIKGRKVPFYDVHDYDRYLHHPVIQEANNVVYTRGKNPKGYINIPCAFDIETSTVNIGTPAEPKYTAFMYHWQFCFNGLCIAGRYWDEFMLLLDKLHKDLSLHENKRLVIFAHFAAFEFQHLRNFIEVESVFARKKRVILKADFNYGFELRCSWALSNMGLAKFIENTPKAFFDKQDGDKFNYLKLRTPSTPLTDEELTYCYCDVAGLVECIAHLLEEDDIGSLPLTSTGFLRRDCRKAVLANPKNQDLMKDIALTPKLYVLCKTARRGGNCHGNAMYTEIEVDDAGSYDRKSSYPAEMEVGLYPVTPFREIRPSTENLESCAFGQNACLLELTLWNVRLTNPSTLPYIALAKCTRVGGQDSQHRKPLIDNGRVVKAQYICLVCTDIDLQIILSQYAIDDIEISSIHIAEYGHLPDEFRLSLLEMFRQKCLLEGGDIYLYNKFKNKINAYFGMMLTDICSPEILYNPTPRIGETVWQEGDLDIEDALTRYYNSHNSFLSYQHGVWVTANARYAHQQGIDAVEDDVLYGDTDSVKFIGDHDADFKRLNEEWLARCDANDINPTVVVDGRRITMGVWEKEQTAKKFKFLGAKKYAGIYIDSKTGKEVLKTTVAGLGKKTGAEYLASHGGLEAFKADTVIPKEFSGRTVSYYIDVDQPYELTINGETFTTGSAIAVVPTTYEFGYTEDYLAYFTSIQ